MLTNKITVSYERNIPKMLREKMQSSREVVKYLRDIWSGDIGLVENCYVLFFNNNAEVIGWHHLSRGGIGHSPIDIRILFGVALACCSTRFILAHNHPSGNLRPSKHDIDMTKRLKDAGKLLDITLLDSIIITEDEHFSFADEGLL